jgi:hypothetical protein
MLLLVLKDEPTIWARVLTENQRVIDGISTAHMLTLVAFITVLPSFRGYVNREVEPHHANLPRE